MYDQVIQEQLAEGVVERVTEEVSFGHREFYLLHRQLFMRILKVQSCGLYMMRQPGKTVEAFH